MKLTIRLERPEDYREVEALTREAFWGVFHPTCDEHYLVHKLRNSRDFVPALDMVAELRALGDVPLEELLAWATGNGAQALGMEERLGGFEAGSRSGAVLLSGLDWGNMRLTEDSRAERLL